MYAIQFAHDREHFRNVLKNKDVGKLRDILNFDGDIAIQKVLNRFSKFRLVNLKTDKMIEEK